MKSASCPGFFGILPASLLAMLRAHKQREAIAGLDALFAETKLAEAAA
jgi:hypothetical protein